MIGKSILGFDAVANGHRSFAVCRPRVADICRDVMVAGIFFRGDLLAVVCNMKGLPAQN